MASLDVHYEILGYNGESWHIVDVAQEEKQALALGRKAWGSGKHRAVRVMRERFETERGVFSSFQIFYEGQQASAKKKSVLMELEDGRPASCWKMGDLYNYEGRRTIAGLLSRTLERWRITPTELLHHPEYYRRLDDSGTDLQNAVQRLAINQIQGTDRPVQERMREIYNIIEQAVGNLNKLWNEGRVPKIDPENLEPAIAQIETDKERGFVFAAGLSDHFKDYEDLPAKFDRCLDMLSPDRPKWVINVLDGMVAELMTMKAVQPGLLARFKQREGAELRGVAQLRHGALDAANDGPEPLDMLNRILGFGILPDSRSSLDRMLLKRIAGAKKLADGALLGELQALGRVADLCRKDFEKSDEFRTQLDAAFAERCEKLLTQYAVSAYLTDAQDSYETLERLIALEPYIFGAGNKRELANYILPILTQPEHEPKLVQIDKQIMARMGKLTRLQALTMKSAFESNQKDKMIHRYDVLCNKMLSDSRLLLKMQQAPHQEADKALKLLRYLADKTFTEGNCASAVRIAARNYMRDGKFLDHYLAQAGDAAQSALELKKLMQLMTAAGLADAAGGRGGNGNAVAAAAAF